MSDAELRALLRLRCVHGLGDVGLARLLREHHTALALLRVPPADLGKHGAERDSATTLRRVERALRVCDELAVQMLALHQGPYPGRLRCLHDAPVVLFARGDLRLLDRVGVAVVGTRHPTDYGREATQQIVSGLARGGVVTWSGAARGIDGVAHCSALDCGGPTVAVLGSGIDVPYPREHAALIEQIAAEGLVLSEFLPGEPPMAHNFPRRNRILGSAPHALLVVEGRENGGALITAEVASNHIPVMAVPGPIGRPTSTGPNRMIQDGAKLVMEAADVLEEIGGPLNAAAARTRPSARKHWKPLPRAVRNAPANPPADTVPRKVVPTALLPFHTVLGADAMHVDALAQRCGRTVPETLAALLELEVDGFAVCSGGKRYRLPLVGTASQPAA